MKKVFFPFLLLVITTLYFRVNVPWDDDWNFIPAVGKLYSNSLSFTDIWQPVNEHRTVIPKIIYIYMIRLTSWDNTYMLLPTIILASFSYLVIFRETRKIFSRCKISSVWPYYAISIMVFSINQFESWLLAGQFAVFLSLLAMICGLILLSGEKFSFAQYLLSISLGIISVFSFGYGVLFWPIGFLLLLINKPGRKVKYLSVWIASSFLIFFLYFFGLKTTNHYQFNGNILNYLISYLLYILLYCGRPLGSLLYHRLIYSIILGFIGLSANIFFLRIIYKKRIVKPGFLFLPIILSFITIGSALITGYTRINSGFEQAHSSRYITVGNLLWISNIILFTLAVKKSKILKALQFPIICIFFILIALTSIRSYKEMRIFSGMLKKGQEAVHLGIEEKNLPKLVHPKHETYQESVLILKKYKLSLFKE